MEFRRDLIFSIPQYGDETGKGLLTLGESKIIQLENGKSVELLPYLIENHCTRGVSKMDPRRRMSNNVIQNVKQLPKVDKYNYRKYDDKQDE